MRYLRRADQIANWLLQPVASIALRYGLALVSVAAALGLAQTFLRFHLPQPFAAFALSAIAITFWYGGIVPGILAAALASLVRSYFFEPDINGVSRILYDVVFVIFALLMAWITQVRKELEAKVAKRTAELTQATESLKPLTKELQRGEAYLAEGQRLSRTGSFGWRVSTGEIIWSEETFRIFQYDRKTIPTVELLLQRVHPEDAALVRYTIERASRDGKDFEHEYRLVMPDGAVKHVHVVAHAVRDESGEIEFVGAVMDVTERRRAEKTLRESEAYLAEAQRLSHTGSWASTPALGEVRYLSEECYRVLGFDPSGGQPRYEAFFQRIHPEDQAKVREAVETAGREKVDFELDYRIVHPGGDIRDIHVVGHPVLSPSGDLVEFVGTVIDVTERKRAEDALRRSESYLAEAQRLAHMGSWVWRVPSKEALHLSDEWYRIYGFDPKKGMPDREQRLERIHSEDRSKYLATIDRAVAGHSDYDIEFRLLLPDGTVKYIQSVGHPVFDASGNLVQFVGSTTDITQRKRSEEDLRQAQADLAYMNRVTTMSELAASLAHEIKQPIAAAVTDANTCLRWLSREHPDVEEARLTATRIVKDATRAAEIISRIRMLFKKGTPERELVDVNELVREMIVLLRSEAARYSISVRTELAQDLPQIMGDRVQLQQVIMNLFTNGVDAMRDVEGMRELAIKSQRAENDQLLVLVSDTGVGLPPQKDQIFNAFFTTKAYGTGMGLAISRSIVESHGGRLSAGDNSPRGASFYLTLRATTEAPE